MQGWIVCVGMQLQFGCQYLVNWVILCLVLWGQCVQVVGIGWYYCEDQFVVDVVLYQIGIVDDGVVVVDVVYLQQVDGCGYVVLGYVEFIGMGGGFEVGFVCQVVGGFEQFWWVVVFVVIYVDVWYLWDVGGQYLLYYGYGFFGVGFVVDVGDQVVNDVDFVFGIDDGVYDGVLCIGIGDVGYVYCIGWILEEFVLGYVMGVGILQVFVGDVVEIVGLLDQFGIQCVQYVQYVYWFFIMGIEGFDFFW